ncbi:hypothetical protein [Amycolatopsis thermoflava]|uniref:hypothetical protein n=1 Tax=Amycolatopsis thermoflava TaxID=84480 RepID=UPI003D73F47E
MDDEIRHIVEEVAFWSGRVTALCGETREYGEYEMHCLFPGGPICPDCRRVRSQKTGKT